MGVIYFQLGIITVQLGIIISLLADGHKYNESI